MRPLAALSIAALAVVSLTCFTTLFVFGAYTFNNYIEARRELEIKEQNDKVIETMKQVAEKIPEFRLLNRKKPSGSSSNHNRSGGVFGR